ncbi:MAG: hypothetical protein ABEJ69_01735 [Candidatus Nanohaloarchaea archaeon]
MSVAELLDGTREVYDELEELHREKWQIESEIEENHRKVRDSVVMALESIQDSLEPGEDYVLMESTETGRGGNYSFEEVLTPEGVEAQNVERSGEPGYSGEDLWTWPGSGERYEEPLDIDSEYLVGSRDSPGFIRKLHRRMEQDEVPESGFFYD